MATTLHRKRSAFEQLEGNGEALAIVEKRRVHCKIKTLPNPQQLPTEQQKVALHEDTEHDQQDSSDGGFKNSDEANDHHKADADSKENEEDGEDEEESAEREGVEEEPSTAHRDPCKSTIKSEPFSIPIIH